MSDKPEAVSSALTPSRFCQTLLLTAFTAAALDALAPQFLSPSIFSRLGIVARNFTAAAMLAAGVHAVLFFMIAYPLTRRRMGGAFAGNIATGYALVFVFFLVGLLRLAPLHEALAVRGRIQLGILAFFIMFMGFAVAIGIYRCTIWIKDHPRTHMIAHAFHWALPLIICASIYFLRGRQFGNPPFFATGAAVGAFLGLALVTLVLSALITRTRWSTLVIFLVVAPVLTAAWLTPLRAVQGNTSTPTTPSHSDNPPNVVLLVVDTLRADAISRYGGASETPNIDALADDSVIFTQAMSPAPWTLPAMASILTGVSPLVHRAVSRGSGLPDELETVAERLAATGYDTASIGKNVILTSPTNVHQGFRDVRWYPSQSKVASTGGAILEWLWPKHYGTEFSTTELSSLANEWVNDHRSDPFLLWFHAYDPHMAYTPPAQYLPPGVTPAPRIGRAFAHTYLDLVRRGTFVPSEAERIWIRALYDAETRYVDDEVGRFIANLKGVGLYDDAIIIITSDHGEEFWEHGGFEHGQSFYQELIHVPLMIKLPKQTTTGAYDSRVSTENITPTILDLCAIGHEPSDFSGVSLKRHWENEEPLPDEAVYATGLLYYDDGEALLFGPNKYIRTFQSYRDELYNLQDDPGETQSIAHQQPEILQEAQERIDRIKQGAAALRNRLGLTSEAPVELDPATQEALESVGYL